MGNPPPSSHITPHLYAASLLNPSILISDALTVILHSAPVPLRSIDVAVLDNHLSSSRQLLLQHGYHNEPNSNTFTKHDSSVHLNLHPASRYNLTSCFDDLENNTEVSSISLNSSLIQASFVRLDVWMKALISLLLLSTSKELDEAIYHFSIASELLLRPSYTHYYDKLSSADQFVVNFLGSRRSADYAPKITTDECVGGRLLKLHEAIEKGDVGITAYEEDKEVGRRKFGLWFGKEKDVVADFGDARVTEREEEQIAECVGKGEWGRYKGWDRVRKGSRWGFEESNVRGMK